MEPDHKIQQYLLLVKNARGLQTAQVILQAAAEPGLFTFGELLDHPAVREVHAIRTAANDRRC
jgi:COP9 signalosome complex subunit 7